MNSINRPRLIRGMVLAIILFTAASAHAMEDNVLFNATRLELDAGRARGDGSDQTVRAEGWIGSDYDRFAWKAEGERTNNRLEEAEAQGLWAHYLAPFWELQAGVRQQVKPTAHTYAALGVRGLAPYAFDVDVALFARSDGRLFARTRAEYDLLWTNRLILRPFAFVDWSASRIAAENTRRGAESVEAGLNLRYEFSRAFAPYVEVSRIQRYGTGDNERATLVRLGLRLLL